MADKKELAELYADVIRTGLGFIAEIDDDFDVCFRLTGVGHFYIDLNADRDPEYMMIVFPNFANAEKLGVGIDRMYEAANAVNSRNKAVKLSIQNGVAFATVEAFVSARDQMPDPVHLKAIIERSFSALQAGAQRFADQFKPDATAPVNESQDALPAFVH
jgi:hypothetical protein